MRTSDSSTIIILIAIILINAFFGYWRSNTRKLSIQWLLAIHIPVLIAIILRITFLTWSWLWLPAFVGAFMLGQFSGGQVRKILKKQRVQLTSVLATDVFRVLSLRTKKNIP